jgi:ATP-binding cassette, subfamily B, bacterial PglK
MRELGKLAMISTFRKLYSILDRKERRAALLLFFIMILFGIIQTLGVASVLPFMALLSDPGIVHSNPWMKRAYDAVGFDDVKHFLAFLGVMAILVLFATQAFSAFAQWCFLRFNAMCKHRISSRLLAAYLHRPYVWFLNHHSADLGRTVLNEVDVMINTAVAPAVTLVSRSMVVLFLLLFIVAIDPFAAIAAFSVLAGMYSLIYLGIRKRLGWLGRDLYEANEGRFRVAQEGLSGIKDVKILGLERIYDARYRPFARRHAEREAAFGVAQQMPRFILEGIVFGALIGISLFMLLYRQDELSSVIPLLTLYAFAGYRLLPALQEIYSCFATLRFGDRVLERTHFELIKRNLHLEDASDSSADGIIEPSSAIELCNVSFRYPGAARMTLDGISISIPAKSTVAFVGATGSGKTTIADLILGLLSPEAGELRIDGVSIDSTNLRRWQRSIGYVPQQIFLTDDTIAANIAFGRAPEEIDFSAVERAGRIAELHSFVASELPEGYQTMIGERGVRLSGGQRQRIGIARALYNRPSVLIFDEATSALDNLTERAVMDAVNNLSKKQTVILIAHRLSTVRNCDRIFLMDTGKLLACGTYEELIENSEQFRSLSQA